MVRVSRRRRLRPIITVETTTGIPTEATTTDITTMGITTGIGGGLSPSMVAPDTIVTGNAITERSTLTTV